MHARFTDLRRKLHVNRKAIEEPVDLLDLVLVVGVKVVRLRYRYGLSCAASIGRYYFIVSLTTRLQRVNRH